MCFSGALVQWLLLLLDFIQPSLNSGSVQVQTLLTTCWKFKMVRISEVLRRFKSCSGHFRDLQIWGSLTMVLAGIRIKAIRRSTIPQKQFIIIIFIIIRSIITCKIILRKKKIQSFAIRLFSFSWTSKSFVLFEVNRLLKLNSLLSKSVLFTKSACFDMAAKFSTIGLLNSWVIIFLELSEIFVLKFTNFCTQNSFSHWTTRIWYFLSTSTIFFSKFSLSVLYGYMWINVVASGVFFSKQFTFVFSVLNFVFLTTLLSTVSLF